MALVGNISGSGGTSNTVGITGSLIIANPGLTPFPILPGNDVALFVSGNISAKPSTEPNYSTRGTTVFGGDVVISGTLFGGSPLYIGSHISASAGFSIPSTSAFVADGGLSGSLQQLANGKSYLVAGSNVTIVSQSNGQILISSTGGGGGGGTSTNFFTERQLNSISASGSIALLGAQTGPYVKAEDVGTDVVFFVSGSTDGSKTTVLGGGLLSSGSVKVVGAGGVLQGYITNQGVISGSGNLSVGGSITVAGNIDTDAAEAKSLFASAGANSITIGGASSTVIAANTLQVNGDITTDADEDKGIFTGVTTKTITIGGGSTSTVKIPGNLTVNGTVVAIDTTNLRVKDAIVLIGSGTTSTSYQSIIAFSSGSKTSPNSLTFGAAGADDTLAAGIQDVKNGEETSISFASLAKVKAAAFKVATEAAQVKAGGTTDSVIISGSLVSLQAPVNQGVNVLASDGKAYLTINQSIGDPIITSSGYIWLSGSSVFLQSDSGTISVAKNNDPGLELTTDGATSATIASKSGSPSNTARALTLTGSTVTIGMNDPGNGLTFAGAGTNILRLSAPTSIQPSFVALQNNAAFKVGTGGGTTDTLILSGTNLQFNAGQNGQSFRRDNSEFLLITSGASGPSQRTNIVASAGKTLVVGGSSETILSGSSLTLLAGTIGSPSGIDLSTNVLGVTQAYANITTGSYNYGSSTSLNVARLVGSTSPSTLKDLLLGASNGRDLHLSGTNINPNHSSAGAFLLYADGVGYLRFTSGPGLGTVVAGQVPGRDVSLTSNGSGRLFLSGSTTTLSGSSIDFVKDGTRVAFFGASGASTGLIPNATNTYDLGTPDLRWRNMYTGDLHLKNERGDWTIIEEKEYLSITNNKSGRRFKFVLEEI